jgi:alkylation response protein AidB-like acyl-CoA dehydrogenase
MEIAGTQGVLRGAEDPAGAYGQRWLSARIATVGGGSQEMQRNGISERVLGLPREATPDRGVPFSEVLASRRSQPG